MHLSFFCHFQFAFIKKIDTSTLKFKKSFNFLNKYLMSTLTHGYDSYGTKKNTQVQIFKNDK
jgi:hypothetical protein